MNKFKLGDSVIFGSDATSGRVQQIFGSDKSPYLYQVVDTKGHYRRYFEEDLVLYEGCDYCLKGKSFNVLEVETEHVASYIVGNMLVTQKWKDEEEAEDVVAVITHCPFCGHPVKEEPDEQIEVEEEV